MITFRNRGLFSAVIKFPPRHQYYCSTSASSSISNLDLVSKIRHQQLIKESNEECEKIFSQGLFMLYHRGKPLLIQNKIGYMSPRLATLEQTAQFIPNLENESVFMKIQDDNTYLFAAMLPKEVDIKQIETSMDAKFTDMRLALFAIRSQWSGLMSGGSSLLRWLKSAKYCWTCRAPLQRNKSGCQLKCSCPECSAVFHPPTSPVGISLIAAPDHSRALLIRQSMYPKGMYSCVAGFVDAGESLADCVARECAEEAGCIVDPDSIQLVGSNHWPNPAGSLMCGCIVTTETTTPSPCSHEIEAVRWFTPQELKKAINVVQDNPGLRSSNKDPDLLFVPPRGAIANVIISTWLKKYHDL